MHKLKIAAVCMAVVTAMAALIGCSSDDTTTPVDNSATPTMTIGTMLTEDALPLWVAQNEGLFTDAGIEVDIKPFQSAQELSTAFAAGEIDAAMTDIQVSATLYAAGTKVFMPFVMLGTTPEQGRFGIMTSPDSGITDLADLAGVPIGVGSNTVPEYVMDQLMIAAGIPADQIVKEEIKKVPVRFETMAQNQVAAAALPGTLLALGESIGCVVLADDTTGANVSQSVLAVSESYATSYAQAQVNPVEALKQAWNKASDRINAQPENYRALLIEMARVPEGVQDSYPVATYPHAELPTSAMVDPVIAWMVEKGYLVQALTYDASTGYFG